MLSVHDADLVRRDPAIPGLATLLDPEALRDLLHHRLVPGTEVRSAQINYVKYKPGSFCRVGYRLELASGALELYAKAYRTDARHRVRRALKCRTAPGLLGPGHLVLEDRATVIFAFPNDQQLQALGHLADTVARRCLLSELLPDRPDLWEATANSFWYRPEKRCVTQMRTADGVQVALKFYAEPGYQAGQRNAAAFSTRGPLRVARRLGRSDRHCAVALEWLPGRRLLEAVSDPHLQLQSVAMVGAALVEVHTQNPEGLRYTTREVEAAALRSLAAALGFLCPHLAWRAECLAQSVAARLAQFSRMPSALHGDFSATQVLLDNGSVGIVDFDGAVRGDSAVDLGSFMSLLESLTAQGEISPALCEWLSTAFLEGYRSTGPCFSGSQVRLYTASALLRRALNRFRVHSPGWAEQAEAILERAERILKTAGVSGR